MKKDLHTPISKFKKICASAIIISYCLQLFLPVNGYAQTITYQPTNLILPLNSTFNPATLKGLKVYPDEPFRFDFIVDEGDTPIEGDDAISSISEKLIKYFLATLTVPEDQLWVNLNPKEADRIIPDQFGQTDMGRDLLSQDFMLKQITAALMNPKEDLGAKFWNRVYAKMQNEYGHQDLNIDTLNRIWIVPETAEIYENDNVAFVTDSRLKVMLEEEYQDKNSDQWSVISDPKHKTTDHRTLTTEIISNILIPEIEREINTGQNFAQLRQIYHSMILATWYKETLTNSLINQNYSNKNKVTGIDIEDKNARETIFKEYLKSFEEGIFNQIKEEYDPKTQQIIQRKYITGGFGGNIDLKRNGRIDQAIVSKKNTYLVRSRTENISQNESDTAMTSPKNKSDLRIPSLEQIRETMQNALINGTTYETDILDSITAEWLKFNNDDEKKLIIHINSTLQKEPIKLFINFKHPHEVHYIHTNPDLPFAKIHGTELFARILIWLYELDIKFIYLVDFITENRTDGNLRKFLNNYVFKALFGNVDLDQHIQHIHPVITPMINRIKLSDLFENFRSDNLRRNLRLNMDKIHAENFTEFTSPTPDTAMQSYATEDEIRDALTQIRNASEISVFEIKTFGPTKDGFMNTTPLDQWHAIAESMSDHFGQQEFTLLDAGGGNAEFAIGMAMILNDIKIIIIESDPQLIKEARENIRLAQSGNYIKKGQIEVLAGNINENEIDGQTAISVYEKADAVYYYNSGTRANQQLAETLKTRMKEKAAIFIYSLKSIAYDKESLFQYIDDETFEIKEIKTLPSSILLNASEDDILFIFEKGPTDAAMASLAEGGGSDVSLVTNLKLNDVEVFNKLLDLANEFLEYGDLYIKSGKYSEQRANHMILNGFIEAILQAHNKDRLLQILNRYFYNVELTQGSPRIQKLLGLAAQKLFSETEEWTLTRREFNEGVLGVLAQIASPSTIGFATTTDKLPRIFTIREQLQEVREQFIETTTSAVMRKSGGVLQLRFESHSTLNAIQQALFPNLIKDKNKINRLSEKWFHRHQNNIGRQLTPKLKLKRNPQLKGVQSIFPDFIIHSERIELAELQFTTKNSPSSELPELFLPGGEFQSASLRTLQIANDSLSRQLKDAIDQYRVDTSILEQSFFNLPRNILKRMVQEEGFAKDRQSLINEIETELKKISEEITSLNERNTFLMEVENKLTSLGDHGFLFYPTEEEAERLDPLENDEYVENIKKIKKLENQYIKLQDTLSEIKLATLTTQNDQISILKNTSSITDAAMHGDGEEEAQVEIRRVIVTINNPPRSLGGISESGGLHLYPTSILYAIGRTLNDATKGNINLYIEKDDEKVLLSDTSQLFAPKPLLPFSAGHQDQINIVLTANSDLNLDNKQSLIDQILDMLTTILQTPEILESTDESDEKNQEFAMKLYEIGEELLQDDTMEDVEENYKIIRQVKATVNNTPQALGGISESGGLHARPIAVLSYFGNLLNRATQGIINYYLGKDGVAELMSDDQPTIKILPFEVQHEDQVDIVITADNDVDLNNKDSLIDEILEMIKEILNDPDILEHEESSVFINHKYRVKLNQIGREILNDQTNVTQEEDPDSAMQTDENDLAMSAGDGLPTSRRDVLKGGLSSVLHGLGISPTEVASLPENLISPLAGLSSKMSLLLNNNFMMRNMPFSIRNFMEEWTAISNATSTEPSGILSKILFPFQADVQANDNSFHGDLIKLMIKPGTDIDILEKTLKIWRADTFDNKLKKEFKYKTLEEFYDAIKETGKEPLDLLLPHLKKVNADRLKEWRQILNKLHVKEDILNGTLDQSLARLTQTIKAADPIKGASLDLDQEMRDIAWKEADKYIKRSANSWHSYFTPEDLPEKFISDTINNFNREDMAKHPSGLKFIETILSRSKERLFHAAAKNHEKRVLTILRNHGASETHLIEAKRKLNDVYKKLQWKEKYDYDPKDALKYIRNPEDIKQKLKEIKTVEDFNTQNFIQSFNSETIKDLAYQLHTSAQQTAIELTLHYNLNGSFYAVWWKSNENKKLFSPEKLPSLENEIDDQKKHPGKEVKISIPQGTSSEDIFTFFQLTDWTVIGDISTGSFAIKWSIPIIPGPKIEPQTLTLAAIEQEADTDSAMQEQNTKPNTNYQSSRHSHMLSRDSDRVKQVSEPTTAINDNASKVGGINLNPDLLNIQKKGESTHLNIPQNPDGSYSIQIDGLKPVIYQIIPITNAGLPFFLGAVKEDDEAQALELALEELETLGVTNPIESLQAIIPKPIHQRMKKLALAK